MSKNVRKEKKTIREQIKEEFINSLIKYLVWTIPLSLILFLLNVFNDNVLFPTLKVDSLNVELGEDKQNISLENSHLPGREYSITENGEVIGYNYHAPELSISLEGKGQIGSAYIIYEQNDDLIIQKVKNLKHSWTGIRVTPKNFSTTINYTINGEEEKRIYIVLMGKNNKEKHIWCGYVNAVTKEVEIKAAEDIYELMLYEKNDKFSIGKEEILKDIAKIYDLNI